MRVLGIVTARGGSKGIPRKNIRPLGGKPLIAWTAEAARSARLLTRTVCTTDDEEIAEVARAVGLDVPFLRPAQLSLDTTPTLPVLQHAVRWFEDHGERFDAVCLLQPTSPLRTGADIDACVGLLEQTGADAVVSVGPVPPEYNPHWVYFADAAGELHLATGEQMPIARRQDLPAAYHRDGAVFVTRRDVLMIDDSLYGMRLVGHVIAATRTLDIDTVEDWERAEHVIRTLGSS